MDRTRDLADPRMFAAQQCALVADTGQHGLDVPCIQLEDMGMRLLLADRPQQALAPTRRYERIALSHYEEAVRRDPGKVLHRMTARHRFGAVGQLQAALQAA